MSKIVLVSSMLETPVSSLFYALKSEFNPLLLEDNKWSENLPPKLKSLLTDLEAALGSLVIGAKKGKQESLGGK